MVGQDLSAGGRCKVRSVVDVDGGRDGGRCGWWQRWWQMWMVAEMVADVDGGRDGGRCGWDPWLMKFARWLSVGCGYFGR
jgi:hypothetical protein